MGRCIASIVIGVMVMLSAELGMSWIVGRIGISGSSRTAQEFTLNVITILVFAFAGLASGAVASRLDLRPLVAVEAAALVFVLTSILFSAVETGASDVVRNSIVGAIGLATLAMSYFVARRLTRQRQP